MRSAQTSPMFCGCAAGAPGVWAWGFGVSPDILPTNYLHPHTHFAHLMNGIGVQLQRPAPLCHVQALNPHALKRSSRACALACACTCSIASDGNGSLKRSRIWLPLPRPQSSFALTQRETNARCGRCNARCARGAHGLVRCFMNTPFFHLVTGSSTPVSHKHK